MLIVLSAWATKHAINGGRLLPQAIRQAFLYMACFPPKAKGVIGLLNHFIAPIGKPDQYSSFRIDRSIVSTNLGCLLIPYINEKGDNQVDLVKIDGSESKAIYISRPQKQAEYSDVLGISLSRRQSAISSRSRICNPYISQDEQLFYLIPWNDFVAVDLRSGEEIWRVHGSFHHSIESDSDGNLWVCAAIDPGGNDLNGHKINHSNQVFEDQALVKISPAGKILEVISVSNLLIDSGLEHLLYGISNPNTNFDPIHLNQIYPIRRDSGLAKIDQLMISLRNLSTVALVDIGTKKIVWHRSGPWMNQHSAVPRGDSEFIVFDNHSFASGDFWLNPKWESKILTHNIASGVTSPIETFPHSTARLRVPLEGKVFPICGENIVFEDCSGGTIMVSNRSGIIFKWSNRYNDGGLGVTSCCRFLEENRLTRSLLKN